MWVPNKYNWQGPMAYFLTIAAMSVGIWAGLKFDPAWLGRAGAIVIVVGILLASSRKIELLQQDVLSFLENYKKNNLNEVRDEYRKLKGSELTSEEAKTIEDQIYNSAEKEIASLLDKRRRIFKIHEVIIVVLGTLTNGFGEWLIKFATNYST